MQSLVWMQASTQDWCDNVCESFDICTRESGPKQVREYLIPDILILILFYCLHVKPLVPDGVNVASQNESVTCLPQL